MAEPSLGGPGLSAGVSQDQRLSWDEYSARWASLHGGVDPRRSSVFANAWMRLSYGTGRALAGMNVGPAVVTGAGLLFSAVVPLVVLPRSYWLFIAAGFVFLSALADSSDGACAIVSGRTSRIGSFYDSVADRLSEAAWLIAFWVLGVPVILVVLCGGLTWLHEYARARAALAGMPGVGAVTVAERPTRVLIVIVALVIGGAVWPISTRLTPGVLTIAAGVWAGLGLLGAARLLNTIRFNLR